MQKKLDRSKICRAKKDRQKDTNKRQKRQDDEQSMGLTHTTLTDTYSVCYRLTLTLARVLQTNAYLGPRVHKRTVG